jgi:hypothetical protein
MSISEARKKITSLENDLSDESIAETLDIISDEQLFSELKAGMQQLKNSELIDFDEFKKPGGKMALMKNYIKTGLLGE